MITLQWLISFPSRGNLLSFKNCRSHILKVPCIKKISKGSTPPMVEGVLKILSLSLFSRWLDPCKGQRRNKFSSGASGQMEGFRHRVTVRPYYTVQLVLGGSSDSEKSEQRADSVLSARFPCCLTLASVALNLREKWAQHRLRGFCSFLYKRRDVS